jgi:cardiolipin synthase
MRTLAAAILCVFLGACAPAPAPVPPVESNPVAAATPEVLLAHHRQQVERVLGAPLAPGNDARLLIDGPATHRAMFDAIRHARRHIHLQTYILEAEGPGERLAELLERKRAEGVQVRVLYDSVGSLGTPREYFERLRAAGIGVCEFNPVNPAKAPRGWQINNRNHRKILVVDGRIAFTGGINISGVYSSGSFGSRRRAPPPEQDGWRDTHVAARGPVVAQFQQIFLDDWERQGCRPAAQGPFVPAAAVAGGWPMRLVAADPERDASETYAVLLSAIARAQRRVWLTYGYFVPDPATLEALLGAARRGVDVRLVLPGVSDFWAPLYAGRSHYDELLSAGVRIFERRDALLHAKTAVIDGVWGAVGSTNLDWRSFVHNYEADLVVLSPGFARELEQVFAADVAAAHPIDLETWRNRGVGSRLKEWVARRWEYLL